MNEIQSIHFSRVDTLQGPAGHEPVLKILLYSHDSWGLGHLRRNLAIAGALVRRIPHANVLIISGSPCATQFPLPERCDVIKLPAIGKDKEGHYVPRSLAISLNDTMAIRRQLIMAAAESFDPDVVVVDHQLTGLLGEVQGMVRAARKAGKLTIYGMRDIIDSAATVKRAWSSQECIRALTEDYQHICIYGDDAIFDTVAEYPTLQPYRYKISTTGYLVSPLDSAVRPAVPSLEPKVLVTVGGGEDGEERVEAYLAALDLAPFDWKSHIITGPLMDESKVRSYKGMVERAGHDHSIKISRFHRNIPGLLQQADAVVSMAGYNSCAEIMQSGRPAILLPRDRMRHEQFMRAQRLSDRGLAASIHGFDPPALRKAVEKALIGISAGAASPNLNGLDNFCDLIIELSAQNLAGSAMLAQADAGSQAG